MDNQSQMRPIVILVMGGPASGKGTYCKKLEEEFGLVHLSIGDIFREERKKDTEECIELDKNMLEFERTGKLMSCDIAKHFLLKRMKEKGWSNYVYLVDGFVKAVAGYYHSIDRMTPHLDLKFVLYLECSAPCMLSRLTKRSESSDRLDDNKSIFDIRVKTFFERTLPAVEMFAGEGLVLKVNTENDMKKVYSEIREAFFKFFPDFKFN